MTYCYYRWLNLHAWLQKLQGIIFSAFSEYNLKIIKQFPRTSCKFNAAKCPIFVMYLCALSIRIFFKSLSFCWVMWCTIQHWNTSELSHDAFRWITWRATDKGNNPSKSRYRWTEILKDYTPAASENYGADVPLPFVAGPTGSKWVQVVHVCDHITNGWHTFICQEQQQEVQHKHFWFQGLPILLLLIFF